MKPQNADDCSPASPRRAPANERSLQGNDAVAKATSGTSRASSLCTSPKINSPLSLKWWQYICRLSSSMSLAKATRQPARSKPRRIKPMPAKNSPKVFLSSILMLSACIFAPSAICAQHRFDALCYQSWRLERMLPHAKSSPAILLKTADSYFIPHRIPSNFLLPVAPIALWHPTVPFASVPKTSINKNNQALTTKNKIRLAGKFQIPAPTGDSISAKDGNQFEFGNLVSL